MKVQSFIPFSSLVFVSAISFASEYTLPRNSNPGLIWWGYRDAGLALGRIKKVETDGDYIKTWESTFEFGDVALKETQKATTYEGKAKSEHLEFTLKGEEELKDKYKTTAYRFSILDQDMFFRLKELDSKKPYIIKYQKSVLRNPLQRKTPYEVVDVYPSYVGTNPELAGLPLEFYERSASSNGYYPEHVTGRLIKVQRWGTLYSGCTITLHRKGVREVTDYYAYFDPSFSLDLIELIKGEWKKIPKLTLPIKTPKDSKRKVMNIIKLNMTSEEGCRYAEDLLAFGPIVEAVYTPYFTEIFDYSRVVQLLKVKPEAEETAKD